MPGNKNTDFLSLFSKNGLNALKQKLVKDKNEPCSINALTQLMQTPLAVPKQGNSLRSLRSKPSRPPQPTPPANTTVINDQTRPDLTKSINVVNGSNEGGTDVLVNNNYSNESVFVVPNMRAPRSLKNETSYWKEEINKAASLAWLVLDKKVSEQLFYILNVHLLKSIEDCAPGTSEIQNPCQDNDVFQSITNWLNNQVSSYLEQASDSDYPEMDNMTSVSGYPPFQSAFGNQNPRAPDYRTSVVNDRMAGYDRMYDQSVVGSMYDDNHFGYGVGRNSTMQGGGPMHPGSVVGSVYQQRNDPFINQSMARPSMHIPGGGGRMLPSFMNTTASVVGSMYHQRNDPYMNQTSFMYKPLMGYPHRPMSVRSDASYAHRPVHNYSQMNQIGLMKDNPLMNQNVTNMRRVPSVVGRANRLNYGEDDENIYESHERENFVQPKRKMLTPLEPVVVLEKLNCDISIAEQRPDQPDLTVRSSRPTSSYKLRNLNDSRNVSNLKRENSTRNNTTSKIQARQIRQVERTVVATPLKEVNMNESSVLRVTRSGRTVRAPQTFWATDLSTLPSYNHTVQMQGIKRKRNYRD